MTSTASVPPDRLASSLVDAITAASDEIDASGNLPAGLVARLRDAGAFRLLTPTELGGHEAPLTTVLRVYEDFGRIDPSVGWIVWNANFGFIGALMDDAARKLVWRPGRPEPVFANSGMPGTAVPADGGYQLSGHWKIVSGIDYASWLVVVGVIATEGGAPDVRLFAVTREQFTVRNMWHVSGMRGTGSNDVVIDSAFVPDELALQFVTPVIDRPLYRGFIPTLVFPGCSAIVLGAAQAAIDASVELLKTKQGFSGDALAERPASQSVVARSEVALHGARLALLDAAEALDAAGRQNAPVTLELRAALRAAMSHAAAVAREVLVAMYELGSSSSIYVGNPVARYFRDGMVALQHANQSAMFFEAAGKVRFGIDPGLPLF